MKFIVKFTVDTTRTSFDMEREIADTLLTIIYEVRAHKTSGTLQTNNEKEIGEWKLSRLAR